MQQSISAQLTERNSDEFARQAEHAKTSCKLPEQPALEHLRAAAQVLPSCGEIGPPCCKHIWAVTYLTTHGCLLKVAVEYEHGACKP